MIYMYYSLMASYVCLPTIETSDASIFEHLGLINRIRAEGITAADQPNNSSSTAAPLAAPALVRGVVKVLASLNDGDDDDDDKGSVVIVNGSALEVNRDDDNEAQVVVEVEAANDTIRDDRNVELKLEENEEKRDTTSPNDDCNGDDEASGVVAAIAAETKPESNDHDHHVDDDDDDDNLNDAESGAPATAGAVIVVVGEEKETVSVENDLQQRPKLNGPVLDILESTENRCLPSCEPVDQVTDAGQGLASDKVDDDIHDEQSSSDTVVVPPISDTIRSDDNEIILCDANARGESAANAVVVIPIISTFDDRIPDRRRAPSSDSLTDVGQLLVAAVRSESGAAETEAVVAVNPIGGAEVVVVAVACDEELGVSVIEPKNTLITDNNSNSGGSCDGDVRGGGGGDLLARIASYYSNSTGDEDPDQENTTISRPPVPLPTYQWEDIRRLKQQGGYPWTHLWKQPLGPDDEPEALLRYRSLPKQRKRFQPKLIDDAHGSPQSLKKVRIDSAILIQETERYIHELDDNNNNIEPDDCDVSLEQVQEDDRIPDLSLLPPVTEVTPAVAVQRKLSFRDNLNQKLNPKGILKKAQKRFEVHRNAAAPTEPKEKKNSRFCHPIVNKLKELARRQLGRSAKKDKATALSEPKMEEKQEILQLRESPKAGGREIGAYIERHESDDFVEIVQLDESPSEVRRRREQENKKSDEDRDALVVVGKETETVTAEDTFPIVSTDEAIERTISEIIEEEIRNNPPPAPKKSTRRQKEHVYEDIGGEDDPNDHLDFTLMTPESLKTGPTVVPIIDLSVIGVTGDSIRAALVAQDNLLLAEMQDKGNRSRELSTQSSGEEEAVLGGELSKGQHHLLAPISSMDSASSEEEKKPSLAALVEESETETTAPLGDDEQDEAELVLKAKASPGAEKKVTFCPSTEDDPVLRKEDVDIVQTETQPINDRWKGMSDHEYEPIGLPPEELADNHTGYTEKDNHTLLTLPAKSVKDEEEERSIQDIQDEMENRYFALTPTTTGSRTDCEINTSAVDSSAIEDLPLDRGSRRSWNVQERGKQMQQKFRSQAGKLKTKFRSMKPQKQHSSPTNPERKKFRSPEFSKLKNIHMPKFSKRTTATETTTTVSEGMPEILVCDTTVEVAHKPPIRSKSSFASKFKSPDFSKFKSFESFKRSSTKTEKAPLKFVSEDVVVETSATKEDVKPSVFKKFEFSRGEKPEILSTTTLEVSSRSADDESQTPTTPDTPKTPDPVGESREDPELDQLDEAKPTKTSRFKTPDFSKFKDLKRPEFTKIDFKKPDFSKFSLPDRPKFSKPDMSKFKMSDRFSSLRLKRTKSLKEGTPGSPSTDSEAAAEVSAPPKKRFEFGTYPRIFSKMKKSSVDKRSTSKSARAGTPPPIIFTTMATSEGTSENESRMMDNESGSYQKYSTDAEEFERETSVERRMREHFSKSMESDDVDAAGIMQTEEQRQMHEFAQENRAIHEISHARRDEFKQRQPLVHQDSDLVSEDNDERAISAKLAEQQMINRLLQKDIEQPKRDEELDRRSIPQSDKDTVSGGGASDRLHRKNVIEEIDDDEFFLRTKGISQDNIRIGEYISSAIREGLTDESINALAQVGGQYGAAYYDDEDVEVNSETVEDYPGYDIPPRRPRRVKDTATADEEEEEENDRADYELRQDFEKDLKGNEDDGYFTTFAGGVPHKPIRRTQKLSQSDDQFVPSPFPTESDNRSYYDNESEIIMMDDDSAKGVPYIQSRQLPMPPPTPPKVPKRRRKLNKQMIKRIENMEGFTGRSVSNSGIQNANNYEEDNIVVYTTEHKIPLATPEKFTPVPTPRRTRSRSRSQVSRFTDDDRTSRGAESLVSEIHDGKNVLELNAGNGYAVIKKDPPPRPPAPLRRKRSTKSLGGGGGGERQFSTLPNLPRRATGYSPAPADTPPRPRRNYSTIVPSRPPRNKSNTSLGDLECPTHHSSPDMTQYEEIGDPLRDLQSGAIVNKMKDRPLPPPPRPERTLPRSRRNRKKDSEHEDDDTSRKHDDSDDRDGGAERIIVMGEETDMCTQTEPLPDDFECDELEITSDMRTITPTRSKTLEDILKEEQAAEIERAHQLNVDRNLTRGLQRFRDGNQRSMSERSRASVDRPKTPTSVVHLGAATLDSYDNVNRDETTAKDSYLRLARDELAAAVPERIDGDKILNTEPAQDEEPYPEDVPDSDIVVEKCEETRLEAEVDVDRLENIIDKLTTVEPVEETPVAPPRRKSSAGGTTEQTAAINDLSGRVQIRDLDVESLNVTRLQAGNIQVSELEGVNITTTDFECRSGNIVVRNIEFPQEVIDQIADRVRCSEALRNAQEVDESEKKKTEQTQQEQPAAPVLPHGFIAIPSEFLTSIAPPSFYQLRSPDQPSTVTTTEATEEAASVERLQKPRRHESVEGSESEREARQSRPPSILKLGGQLASACGQAVVRTISEFAEWIPSSITKEVNRREINVILLILIIIIVCLIAVAMGGSRTIHHHHWDFFNAPGSDALD